MAVMIDSIPLLAVLRAVLLAVLWSIHLTSSTAVAATSPQTARGVVYHDRNGNGQRDRGERPLPGVLVSNQREVVRTDSRGRWELPASTDTIFFVIKPAGWMTPTNHHRLPQFYYIHKPDGSPAGLKYPGVAPTGPLPPSIDFALHPQPEPGQFKAVFFGDPQPRDQKELDFIARDVVAELIGTDAKFGVSLGDILFDDLSLFASSNALIALIGIPWYNVIGNHDMNYDVADDRHSDETFHRHFGPNYFAYEHGPVVFVALDNVRWGGAKPAGTGTYTAQFGSEQLAFVRHLLPHIARDKLILFMMHIPLYDTVDREALFRLIEDRPYTMSISGHTHWHAHRFLDDKQGWRGKEPHHHVVNVTVCGSWWAGEPDDVGIPHAMMADGGPNGYTILNFNRQRVVVDYKAARRPGNYQMNVFAPDEVTSTHASEHSVWVNVFNGSEKSKVWMRLGQAQPWTALAKVLAEDPYFLQLKQQEKDRTNLLGRALPAPGKSAHLWKAALPPGLAPGEHLISVQTEDMYGRVFSAARSLRVR
jgi:C terminal of Calcineurin-like phosphoesterase/N terminal of Calcineurin-like phosphoesterase/Calcineurin-like phosphoesterase